MKTSALVLAAGAGTRMKSSTPKVAHAIMNKPLVRWVIDAAKGAGVDSVVSVVGHGRDIVEPLVSDTTVVVQEEQLGTAHAVRIAQSAFDTKEGSLVVLTGDSPLITSETICSLIETQQSEKAAVAVLTMKQDDPFGYGRIIRDDSGCVCGIVEQKDCTEEQASITECNSGFYCFDQAVLLMFWKQFLTNNAQNEYYLTDVLAIAYKRGMKVIGIEADDPSECLGVNSRSQLAEATAVLQQRINRKHMDEGVSIMDPRTTWIRLCPHVKNLMSKFFL